MRSATISGAKVRPSLGSASGELSRAWRDDAGRGQVRHADRDGDLGRRQHLALDEFEHDSVGVGLAVRRGDLGRDRRRSPRRARRRRRRGRSARSARLPAVRTAADREGRPCRRWASPASAARAGPARAGPRRRRPVRPDRPRAVGGTRAERSRTARRAASPVRDSCPIRAAATTKMSRRQILGLDRVTEHALAEREQPAGVSVVHGVERSAVAAPRRRVRGSRRRGR